MKKIVAFLFLFVCSTVALGGSLDFQREISFVGESQVYIQSGKIYRRFEEIDTSKGNCCLKAMFTGVENISNGASLAVEQIVSKLEIKQVTLKLGGTAQKRYELFCEIPEFPDQEKLRAIVLKKIHDDKEWTTRYNQMQSQEQANAIRVFMARAANQILDEEFDFIMTGVAQLNFQ